MKLMFLCVAILFGNTCAARAAVPPAEGTASWYGEEHRGKLMANGKKFNPDKLTAASWFYPLGAKVRVTLKDSPEKSETVLVTITDRGPARELASNGRVIDLAYSAFKKLGDPDVGLLPVTVQFVR